MKEAYNWKSLFIAAVLVVLGIGLIVVSSYISVIPSLHERRGFSLFCDKVDLTICGAPRYQTAP